MSLKQQLDDVFLAIAATDGDALNQRGFRCHNARLRLVNVVDNQPPLLGGVPSIVDRSPLLIAIFSGSSSAGIVPADSRKSKRCCHLTWDASPGGQLLAASYQNI